MALDKQFPQDMTTPATELEQLSARFYCDNDKLAELLILIREGRTDEIGRLKSNSGEGTDEPVALNTSNSAKEVTS